MVSPRNEIPHQYSRIIRSKTSHIDIQKIQRCQTKSSVDNIVALTYLMKMGGTQNLKMVELTKEI